MNISRSSKQLGTTLSLAAAVLLGACAQMPSQPESGPAVTEPPLLSGAAAGTAGAAPAPAPVVLQQDHPQTYTVVPGVGTSGLQVDPYVYEDGIGKAASSKRILLSGLESNADARTNVALFLTPGGGLADSAEVDVNVYDFLGRKLRSIWVQLTADKPIAQLSNDELFAGLTTTDAERASIIIDNPRGVARVGSYATVIDRKSLDATFVAGQPVP